MLVLKKPYKWGYDLGKLIEMGLIRNKPNFKAYTLTLWHAKPIWSTLLSGHDISFGNEYVGWSYDTIIGTRISKCNLLIFWLKCVKQVFFLCNKWHKLSIKLSRCLCAFYIRESTYSFLLLNRTFEVFPGLK